MADFDADGFGELAVGVPGENDGADITGAGALHVVFGSPLGLDAGDDQFWYQNADIQAAAVQFGDHFGHGRQGAVAQPAAARAAQTSSSPSAPIPAIGAVLE